MRITEDSCCSIYEDRLKGLPYKGWIVETDYIIEASTEEEAEDIATEIHYFIQTQLPTILQNQLSSKKWLRRKQKEASDDSL